MKIIHLPNLDAAQKKSVLKIWNDEYPEPLAYNRGAEFENYLRQLTNQMHLLLIEEGEVRGWLMVFTRNQERWLALILARNLQGQGWGAKLLAKAKQEEKEINGWVINHDEFKKSDGRSYRSPVSFYQSNGFELLTDKISNDKLKAVKMRWRRS